MSTRARDEHARDAPGDDRPATQSESGVAFSPFLEPGPPAAETSEVAAPLADVGASRRATSPPDPPRFARLSRGSAFELHAHSEMTTNAPESTRGCGRPPQPAPCVSPERNCPRCAQLAAESAAKDVSVRALTQTLSRTRALLDAIQDLAEQQATHEQRSDSRMTSLEEKVARYRDALRSADDGETDARAESSGIRRHDIAEIDHDLSDSSRSSSVERNYTNRRRNSVGRHKVHGGSEFSFSAATATSARLSGRAVLASVVFGRRGPALEADRFHARTRFGGCAVQILARQHARVFRANQIWRLMRHATTRSSGGSQKRFNAFSKRVRASHSPPQRARAPASVARVSRVGR